MSGLDIPERARPTGAELIAAERQRQVDDEGHTAHRDALYTSDELARAAGAYLTYDMAGVRQIAWPWSAATWKPAARESHDGYWTAANIAARTRDLARAGALIAAEIDRLQRLDPEGATP